MGTLKNPDKRLLRVIDENRLFNTVNLIKSVAKKTKLDVNIIAEIYRTESFNRFVSCYVDNGDFSDEQMSGFASILENLSCSFKSLSDSLSVFIQAKTDVD